MLNSILAPLTNSDTAAVVAQLPCCGVCRSLQYTADDADRRFHCGIDGDRVRLSIEDTCDEFSMYEEASYADTLRQARHYVVTGEWLLVRELRKLIEMESHDQ